MTEVKDLDYKTLKYVLSMIEESSKEYHNQCMKALDEDDIVTSSMIMGKESVVADLTREIRMLILKKLED